MTAVSIRRIGRVGVRVGGHRLAEVLRGGDPAYRPNWIVAALVPVVSLVLAGADPRLRHWLLVPVTVCGVLITVDAAEWFRRRTDVFDPRALIGLFGFHFFYLAPILHVMVDFWAPEGIAPADWRDALGSLAVVNAIGLLIYRGVLSLPAPTRAAAPPVARSSGTPGTRSGGVFGARAGGVFGARAGAASGDGSAARSGRRPVDERVFHGAGRIALAVGVCAFLGQLVLFGGVGGFLHTVSTDRQALAGLGWLLILGDSFPLLAFVLVVVRWRRLLARRRRLLGPLLAGMIVTQFVVAGLRGSRTNTIWPVLVAVIVIHLLVVPVTRRALGISALALVVFLYGYGLYKGSGVRVLDVVRGERSFAQVSNDSNRDLPLVLLGDLARADINARMLERLRVGGAPPAYGLTYVGGASFLVPRFVLPERPRDKVAVGTDIIYGAGSYAAGKRSSRAYGITGEGIMNFGVLGGLLSFAALAFAVRHARRFYLRARRSPRLVTALLAPSVCLLALNLLLWDFGNIVWFALKHVGPLAAVLGVAILFSRSFARGRLRRLQRGLITVGTPGAVARWWGARAVTASDPAGRPVRVLQPEAVDHRTDAERAGPGRSG